MNKTTFKKLIFISILVGITALTIFFVWDFEPVKTPQKRFTQTDKTWNITPVSPAFEFTHKKILGEVVSLKKAYISSRRGGVIQDVYIDIGDDVYAGQVVASLLPEGVAGQDQALIAQAQAKIDQAQSALQLAEQVKIDSVALSVKNWRQAAIDAQTDTVTDNSSAEQLQAEKQEAKIISAQVWENLKVILYARGDNSNYIVGSFNNDIQEGKVKSAAEVIESMNKNGSFGEPELIVSHLKHLEDFLKEVEKLYSSAKPFAGLTEAKINDNVKTLQAEQLRLNSIRQSILALEEKAQTSVTKLDSGEAGIEQALKTLDLTETQQNERTTQAQRNLEVAVAQYNAVLNQFSQNQIISQYSGQVAHRLIDVGQTVGSNSQLFELENSNTSLSQSQNFQIQAHVPESFWGKLAIGETVEIRLPYNSENWAARVISIGQSIDQTMGGFLTVFEIVPKEMVEEVNAGDSDIIFVPDITFETPDLADEMTLYVYLNSDAHIYTVPTLALKKRSNNYYLWKMENETPQQIQVDIVAEDGEFSQVSSQELALEDSIISNPSVSLFNQSP
jgi:multidrug efflux pump subunit AcrA (membrane-fusion protein)